MPKQERQSRSGILARFRCFALLFLTLCHYLREQTVKFMPGKSVAYVGSPAFSR